MVSYIYNISSVSEHVRFEREHHVTNKKKYEKLVGNEIATTETSRSQRDEAMKQELPPHSAV
jgi:hypothetical protein